jgi:glycosyltransferase involved in cell wall biosynthesis
MSDSVPSTALAAPFDVDGRHLNYPGTGLGLVTAEMIRALAAQLGDRRLRVFLEANSMANLADYGIADLPVDWVAIPYKSKHPDYVDRWWWGRHVLRAQGRERRPLFIPYLYNYGRLSSNYVFIPDLIYYLIPDYGAPSATPKPWWNRRGRLPFRPMVRRWEERRAAKAKRVLVTTDFVRDHVSKVLGVAAEKFVKIPHGPPQALLDAWKNPSIAPAGLPPRYVLYCGGYAVRKNVPLLLRACARVAQAEPNFRCIFAGLDEKRRAEFGGTAAGSPAIIGLPKVDNALMVALYRGCDFVVYPSQGEGFGLPILEAAIAGKLCLCGDNTSMRELQADARFRRPADDENAWVEIILERWRNIEETRSAGEAARAWAAHYTWAEAAKRLLAAATPD